MCGQWFLSDTLLQRLAQDLEHMARARGQLIQEHEAMVRQRYLPRQGPLAAADRAHSGDGVVGGPERARGDEGGAPASEASDAEVTHASYEGQSVSSRPGRFHPHRQRHQLIQIN
jgi:hypothetical protein